jgi:two-component system sensor histidine kinase MprB
VSLRLRIALLVVAVVTVVVVVVGERTYTAAESEFIEEVDLELVDRARSLLGARGPGGAFGLRSIDEVDRPAVRGPGARLFEAIERDLWARLVTADGAVLRDFGAAFETSVAPNDFPTEEALPVLGDAEIGGARGRVVTVSVGDLGFVQIARPLTEIDQSLDDLVNRIFLIGLLAVLGAGGFAWFSAGSTVEPIRRLTAASERVAQTGDFDHPVDGAGGAEVGRLAASFNSMLAALSASRRQQHRLVMDASHELRTPLASMQTNIDVLRSRPNLEPEMHAAVVDDLHAEIGELSALVAELVDLATDVGEEEPVAAVELSSIVEPIVQRASRRGTHDVVLDLRAQAVVEGRPVALARAVRNLVENAMKFAPEGTCVRVEVDGGQVIVHDQGPGIPQADREVVFERFHRVEATRTFPGSGLGLAIVRQVAEAHDGSVVASASPDGGAAVGFSVPTSADRV